MDGNVGNRAGKLTLQPFLSTYSYSPAAPGPGSEAACVHLTAVMFPSKGCHSWGTQKSQRTACNYPGTDWEISNDAWMQRWYCSTSPCTLVSLHPCPSPVFLGAPVSLHCLVPVSLQPHVPASLSPCTCVSAPAPRHLWGQLRAVLVPSHGFVFPGQLCWL